MAAESGRQRAARWRELEARHEQQAATYAALAAAVEKGNVGEQRVANRLDVLEGAGWRVLNDRYKPGSRANIDHVVVGPPGVFVVDAKNWRPARLRLDGQGMAVAGHRRDKELAGVIDAARLLEPLAQRAHPDVRCRPVLAFVQDMQLDAPVQHHGVCVLQLPALLTWLTSQERELDPQAVQRVASTLDAVLPPRAGSPTPLAVPQDLVTVRPGTTPSRRRTRSVSGRGRQRRPPAQTGRVPRAAARDLALRLLFLAVVVLVLLPALVQGLAGSVAGGLPTPGAPTPGPSPAGARVGG